MAPSVRPSVMPFQNSQNFAAIVPCDMAPLLFEPVVPDHPDLSFLDHSAIQLERVPPARVRGRYLRAPARRFPNRHQADRPLGSGCRRRFGRHTKRQTGPRERQLADWSAVLNDSHPHPTQAQYFHPRKGVLRIPSLLVDWGRARKGSRATSTEVPRLGGPAKLLAPSVMIRAAAIIGT